MNTHEHTHTHTLIHILSLLLSSLISRVLQRVPADRASLEDIEGHDWLQGIDPFPAGPSSAPLASHRCLSSEEHQSILNTMTSGNIATQDAIIK